MKLNVSKKIGLVVGVLVLIVTGALGLYAIDYSGNVMRNSQEESMSALAEEGAKRVEELLNARLEILKEYTLSNSLATLDLEQQRAALTGHVERLGYMDMAVVGQDGTALYVLADETSQLGDRDYIKKALNGQANVSEVIISKVTNSPVVMYAVPLDINGSVVGVLIGRRDGTDLNEITDELKMGEKGYSFIVNSKSVLNAHPNRELVLQQENVFQHIEDNGELKSLGVALKELGIGNKGIITYDYQGESRISAMAPITGTGFTIGIGSFESEIMRDIYSLRNLLIMATLVVAVLGFVAGLAIGKYIAGQMLGLLDSISKMSSFDFTKDQNGKIQKLMKKQDEIGVMARSLEEMKTNLTRLIGTVGDSSDRVAMSSNELTTTTNQYAIAAGEVARAIEEISKGAMDQAKETEQGALDLQELNAQIEFSMNLIVDLTKKIQDVADLKDRGLEAVNDLSKKNSASMKASEEIRTAILDVDTSVEKIKSASNKIKSIASQTNLLSLNASIEAARAGEAGRGFAIVAGEIGQLSEQSNLFTNEIDMVIQDLTKKTEASVKAISEVGTIMESQSASVINTNEKFEGISEAIEAISNMTQSLSNISSIMASRKDNMTSVIENLSAISEENAAGTQEASASVEEQAASIDEIANACESLSELAAQLKAEIHRFKI